MNDSERAGRDKLIQAIAWHQAGRLAQAENLYSDVLRAQPRQFDALHLLGVIAIQKGDPEHAEHLIADALTINPSFTSAHINLGIAQTALMRPANGLRSFERALAIEPASAEALRLRGSSLHALGHTDDALRSLNRAIAVGPANADALTVLGGILSGAAKYRDAVGILERAIALRPDSPEAWNSRGAAAAALMHHDRALTDFDRALTIESGHAAAMSNRANALKDMNRLQPAYASYRRAISLAPADPECWSNFGDLFRLARFIPQAIALFKRALALRPTHSMALTNYGLALTDAGCIEAALAPIRRAIAMEPSRALSIASLADPLYHANDPLGMRRALKRALAVTEGNPRVHFMLAVSYMLTGDLPLAWRHYEYRFASPPIVPPRPFPQPWWRGEKIGGKLLVWAEQGLGDEVAFGSMLPDLTAAGVDAVVEVDERLVSIFSRSFPGLEFVGRQNPPNPRLLKADLSAQIALGSLASMFRSTPQNFRRKAAFLSPNPTRQTVARQWLSRLSPGAKVGIAWRSAKRSSDLSRWHTELKEWGPILSAPGIEFVNLQYGDCSAELDEAARLFGRRIYAWNEVDLFSDLEGLLALSSSLDLVISTGSSTYTLPAAAATELWLLLPRNDYLVLGEDRIPWLPHTRGFFREPGHDWTAVIGEIGAALRRRFIERPH